MLSSPFPDDLATVRLQVAPGSPVAEVFLIDHKFVLVHRSVGDLDADVEPGVYNVKARLGEVTTERLIVLNSDQRVDLSNELPVASPAPIEGTSRTHELHMDVAVSESTSVAISSGRGAEIFLLTRRWSSRTPEDGDPRSEPRSLSELSLHRPDGETILDLGRSGSDDFPDWDPVAGTTIAVDPGAYLLRWRDGSGITAEQSVQAVRGWQSQVFLLEEGHGAGQSGRHRVSVLMSQHGFRPDDSMLRVVEETRSALADERKIASEFINESLFDKFDNPMLGLFGAHLMLLAQEAVREAEEEQSRRMSGAERLRPPVGFDQSLFDGVVDNLRYLLGPDHPDVVALSTKSVDLPLDALQPVTVPPMLWRSWLLLIEASNTSPALVPIAVWRRTLTLLPLRPFLVWSPEKDDGETASEWERSAARALGGSALRPSAAASLGPGGPGGSLVGNEARRRLSLQLLAPRAAIDELVGGAPL